jgi:hypothetical protein
MMKRLTSVVAMAVFTVMATAAAAIAETTYPIKPTSSTVVRGASGTRGGSGTAFTGSSFIPVGTLLVAALLVIGLAALYAARRRSVRLAG